MMNKTNSIRQLTTVLLLCLLALPLSAQENADSVFMFRFRAAKDMFFSPGMNNEKELARLFDCVDTYRNLILGHEIPLYVNGYCNSGKSDADCRAIAKIRSNRVKSELITRKGLKEDCFITSNHTEQGDFVTVHFTIAKNAILPEPQAVEQVTVEQQPLVESAVASDSAATDSDGSSALNAPAVADAPRKRHVEKTDSRFALKTNLLGYAILMPNIEAEWKFADRWSAALEYQVAWYSKSSPRKVYRLAMLTPEVRYWAISRSRWHGMYVGVFGGAGLYDLSNKKKGHEGEGFMAGVSIGYMWPISKHLSLDAGIGAGYMHARDKEYTPLDGHFLYQLTKNINYVGPLRAKLSLVWRIPN